MTFHIIGPWGHVRVKFLRTRWFSSTSCRDSGFKHIFCNCQGMMSGRPKSTSFISTFHIESMFFFEPASFMSSTYTDKNSPFPRFTNEQSQIGTFSYPCSKRTFSNCLSHSSPAKGWPYRFRSRRTTGSSILDHDLGHLCFGRRIQISGQDDVCHESQLRFDFQSLLVASALTKMNASSWRKGRITILYEVQVGNRFLRGLYIVDQAVAWLVVQEGLVCFLLQWFLHVRHTVFCICASRLQSHSADSLVLEYLLYSKKLSRIFRSDFFHALWPRRNGLPMRFHRIEWYVPRSTKYLTKDLRYLSSSCHLSRMVL